MMQYAISNKVVIRDDAEGEARPYRGLIGTVGHIANGNPPMYLVQFDSADTEAFNSQFYFYEHELDECRTVCTTEDTWVSAKRSSVEVGDRVRIDCNFMDCKEWIGKVIDTNFRLDYPYVVEFGPGWTANFKEEELIVLSEVEMKERNFQNKKWRLPDEDKTKLNISTDNKITFANAAKVFSVDVGELPTEEVKEYVNLAMKKFSEDTAKKQVVEDYKFDEPRILQDIQNYIDSTYFAHYAKGDNAKVQTTELISTDPLRGLHFACGNVSKYVDRCEHKGTLMKDLLKCAHYIVIAIHNAERLEKEKNEE